jgi:DNA-binding response OmpR family regulator
MSTKLPYLLSKEWIANMISPCILLIHNDVKVLIKLEAVLKQAGYRVLTAHDRRQGIYLTQAALPEVVTCDAAMSMNNAGMRSALTQDLQIAPFP